MGVMAFSSRLARGALSSTLHPLATLPRGDRPGVASCSSCSAAWASDQGTAAYLQATQTLR